MGARFEFATATRIIFGAGTLREAGREARAFSERALVVTGRDASRADRLVQVLAESGVRSTVYATRGEPDLRTVNEGRALAKRQDCGVVISFGGGSPLDAAKAIAAMLTNDGELLDYLEVIGRGKTLAKPSAPFIAIPTTAGTGSEVTRNSVLASPEHKVKVSLRSPLMLAKLALIDPELTRDLPAGVTASTGLDALTQLIEPFVCSRANPATDALCREGLSRAARSLRKAVFEGHNADAREDMCVASLFGGFALANAGLGAVHGLAGPIGGMFPAPHGAVCAALLWQVMEANITALHTRQPNHPALARYAEVARILTGNPQGQAADGVQWVRQLVSELQIPPLSAYGITRDDIPVIVKKATPASSMKANPIQLAETEIAAVMEQALG